MRVCMLYARAEVAEPLPQEDELVLRAVHRDGREHELALGRCNLRGDTHHLLARSQYWRLLCERKDVADPLDRRRWEPLGRAAAGGGVRVAGLSTQVGVPLLRGLPRR